MDSARCNNKCHEKIEKIKAEHKRKGQAYDAKQNYLIAGKSKNEQVTMHHVIG
jgi:hypothetical protein